MHAKWKRFGVPSTWGTLEQQAHEHQWKEDWDMFEAMGKVDRLTKRLKVTAKGDLAQSLADFVIPMDSQGQACLLSPVSSRFPVVNRTLNDRARDKSLNGEMGMISSLENLEETGARGFKLPRRRQPLCQFFQSLYGCRPGGHSGRCRRHEPNARSTIAGAHGRFGRMSWRPFASCRSGYDDKLPSTWWCSLNRRWCRNAVGQPHARL